MAFRLIEKKKLVVLCYIDEGKSWMGIISALDKNVDLGSIKPFEVSLPFSLIMEVEPRNLM
jgi:hypothetical protein